MGKISSKAKRIAAASFAAVLLITSVPNMDAVAAEASNATKAVITRTSDWWGKIETAREKNSLKEPDGESVETNGGDVVTPTATITPTFIVKANGRTISDATTALYSDADYKVQLGAGQKLVAETKYYYKVTRDGFKEEKDSFTTPAATVTTYDISVNLTLSAPVLSTTSSVSYKNGSTVYIPNLSGISFAVTNTYDSEKWEYEVLQDGAIKTGNDIKYTLSGNWFSDSDNDKEHTYSIKYKYIGSYGSCESNTLTVKTIRSFKPSMNDLKSLVDGSTLVYQNEGDYVLDVSSKSGLDKVIGAHAKEICDSVTNEKVYIKFLFQLVSKENSNTDWINYNDVSKSPYKHIWVRNIEVKVGNDTIYLCDYSDGFDVDSINLVAEEIPVKLEYYPVEYNVWQPSKLYSYNSNYVNNIFTTVNSSDSNKFSNKDKENLYNELLKASMSIEEYDFISKLSIENAENKCTLKQVEDALVTINEEVSYVDGNYKFVIADGTTAKSKIVPEKEAYKDFKSSYIEIDSAEIVKRGSEIWFKKDYQFTDNTVAFKYTTEGAKKYRGTPNIYDVITIRKDNNAHYPNCDVYLLNLNNSKCFDVQTLASYLVVITDKEAFDNMSSEEKQPLMDYIQSGGNTNYEFMYQDTGKVMCSFTYERDLANDEDDEEIGYVDLNSNNPDLSETFLNAQDIKDNKNIKLELSNLSGSGIETLKYYVYPCVDGVIPTRGKLTEYISTEVEPAGGTSKWNDVDVVDSGVYSITLGSEQKDNKYIVLIKWNSPVNVETMNYYASNAITIDSKPPVIDISATYTGLDTPYVTADFNKTVLGEGLKIRNDSLKVTITVNDSNLDWLDDQNGILINLISSTNNKVLNDKFMKYEIENAIRSAHRSNDNHTATIEFTINEQHKYDIEVDATDLSNNSATTGKMKFTLDNTPPMCSLINSIDNESISGLYYTINFDLFSLKQEHVEVVTNDDTSSCSYTWCVSDKVLPITPDTDFLKMISDNKLKSDTNKSTIFLDNDTKSIIYVRLVDENDNVSYYSSQKGIIVDTKDPTVHIIKADGKDQKFIYKDDVELKVTAQDETVGGVCSGLKSLKVYVVKDGVMDPQPIKELTPLNYEDSDLHSINVVIPSSYNSNDIVVKAVSEDNAGHIKEDAYPIMFDSVTPKYSVTWDNQNPTNGKYYDKPRTATIHVKERNFDPGLVNINLSNKNASISGWSVAGGVGDETDHICTVTFTADGDYSMSVDCTDMAGNVGENTSGTIADFTIDRTAPIIEVSYNGTAKNTSFYSNALTATVTVTEHNFDAAAVAAEITAQLNGAGIKSPTISAFTSNGDKHTATISFATDGDYTLALGCNDKAGNAATRYDKQTFTVDLSAPKVDISGVSDKTANRGNVIPVIVCDDVNLEKAGISIVFKGANTGLHTLDEIGYSIDDQGGTKTLTVNDFPYTEDMDDLYTMVVTITDQAGNVTEQEVEFSVNRFGSVYVLDDSTKEWLGGSEDEGGTKFAYINDSKDVGIIEYNVDEVTNRQIFYGLNSDTIEVKDEDNASAEDKTNSKFYKIDEGTDKGWHEYHYTIDKANFDKEGNYAVTIYTEDTADNKSSNTSNKHEAGPLNVEFAVDKTAPTIVISGADDKDKFTQDSLTLKVDAQDNIQIDKVNIDVNGQVTEYTSDQLRDMDGSIEVILSEKNEYQDVKVSAVDMAGNAYQDTDKYGNETDSKAISVLVTSNIFVYFVNSIWLFIAIGAVVVLLGALIIVVVRKRRK